MVKTALLCQCRGTTPLGSETGASVLSHLLCEEHLISKSKILAKVLQGLLYSSSPKKEGPGKDRSGSTGCQGLSLKRSRHDRHRWVSERTACLGACLAHKHTEEAGWREGLPQGSPRPAPLTLDGLAELEGHVAHLVDGVGQVVVVFEEIEGAKAQKLKGDTHVAMVVKPVKHLDTEAGER